MAWAAVVATGFGLMGWEEFTPVRTVAAVSDFPANGVVTLAPDKPTLLVFLHPQCPCSRATMHELEKLLGQTQQKVAVTIIFTIPRDTPPNWEKGDLWNWANAMTGVRVARDENGIAARQFGVAGSGHTLLYDSSGRLLFSGGITASRGEEGDNAGETAIADFVLHGHAGVTRTPVYGCSLL
jgi:hypothetical protein